MCVGGFRLRDLFVAFQHFQKESFAANQMGATGGLALR